jgi:hypothetical protein
MDDADRRQVGYLVADRCVRGMRVGDLLDILTECERRTVLKMMKK